MNPTLAYYSVARRIFFFLILLCFPIFTFGQNNIGVVTGNVTDSTGQKPIVYATVSIMNVKDTSIVSYRITDEKGLFKVTNLPLNVELRMVITAVGYSAYRQEVFLTQSVSNTNFNSIKLTTSNKTLDEVLIKGERPPVMVGKDTTEFNAEAFKTLPAAVVEDLLKKLPGVEVDDNGTMTVNGRPVNRILVDSKEFFGENMHMATKNLPANLVSKIQVSDDKEQLARNPDIDRADLGQIVNIRLKKEIKQGLFGKVNGGVGTNDRYTVGGNVNTFRNKVTMSLVGNSHNTNQGGNGIPKSSSYGANFNFTLSKKTTLSVNYNKSSNSNFLQQKGFSQQFLGDTTIYSSNTSENRSGDTNNGLSAYLKVKIDTSSMLEYRPSFNFSKNDSRASSNSNSYRIIGEENIQEALNDGRNSSFTDNSSFSTNHELSYQKTFKKRGRHLYSTTSFNMNGSDNNRYSDVTNNFFLQDKTVITNQYRYNGNDQYTVRLFATYNEPLTKTVSLRLMQSVSWSNNDNRTDTYRYNEITGQYDQLLPELTNGIDRGGLRNNTSLALRYRKDKLWVTPGVSFQYLDFNSKFKTGNDIPQKFNYFLPTLQVRYDRFTFNYNANVSEPSISDLQPVTNNSNPLYITLGNPDLKPSIAHNLGINMEKFSIEKQRTYSFSMNGSVRDNAVIRARTIDANGAQVTMPVNINGLWNANANGRINKQWKFNDDWRFSLGASANGGYSQGLMILNDVRNTNTNWNAGGRGNFSFNWRDKFEIDQSYGPNYTKNTNNNSSFKGASVWRQSARTGLIIRLPKQFVWDAQFNFNYNPQVAEGMPKSAKLLNAGLGYLFLKQDAAQIRISAFDLLNQNFRVSRSINQNMISDSESNFLSRYFMIHFSYNIRNLGTKMPSQPGERGGGPRGGGFRGGEGGSGMRMGPPTMR